MAIDIEIIRQYNLKKSYVAESMPFGPDVVVYKVYGKIFCLLRLAYPHSISLKCDPEEALCLRDQYDFVIPGYHLNKKHWNTWMTDAFYEFDLLTKWIDHSYQLVLEGIPEKKRHFLTGS